MRDLMHEASNKIKLKNKEYNLGLEGKELAAAIKEEFNSMVSDTVDTLVNSLNSMSSGTDWEEGFIEGLTKNHRHLQSEFWNHLAGVCKRYANLYDGFFDGRNEWAKDAAGRMFIASLDGNSIDLKKYKPLLKI